VHVAGLGYLDQRHCARGVGRSGGTPGPEEERRVAGQQRSSVAWRLGRQQSTSRAERLAFEYINDYYPDTDDTAMVLMALRLVRPDRG